MDRLTDA